MRKQKFFIVAIIAIAGIIQLFMFNRVYAQTGNSSAIPVNNPFLGNWDITTDGGQAGWLSVTIKKGVPSTPNPYADPPSGDYYLYSELLWVGSHVNPMAWTYMDGDALVVYRTRGVPSRDENGKTVLIQTAMEKYTFRIDGDNLTGVKEIPNSNQTTVSPVGFTAVRSPDLPPAPDISKARFGEPELLFTNQNMEGWKLANADDKNGWRIEDGILVNEVVRDNGVFTNFGNLMSVKDYGDVNLTFEVKVPEMGNSGVYLRGMYEIQIEDSYNKTLSNVSMGALYNRVAPTVKVELPAGEWQTLDVTLVHRHLTVILNGTTIIDNQPVLGCTTGSFRSNQTLPGPIVIQGENTSVSFRNMVVRQVIE